METSRRHIIPGFGIALALLAGVFSVYVFMADYFLERSWNGFIESVEACDASSTAGYLAKDYADGWGYTRQTLSIDIKRMMGSVSRLKLTLNDVTITRTGSRAVIMTKVNVSASGYGHVNDAVRQINGLAEPFVLQWKREGLLPWKWRVVRIEQRQFDARRYGKGFRATAQ